MLNKEKEAPSVLLINLNIKDESFIGRPRPRGLFFLTQKNNDDYILVKYWNTCKIELGDGEFTFPDNGYLEKGNNYMLFVSGRTYKHKNPIDIKVLGGVFFSSENIPAVNAYNIKYYYYLGENNYLKKTDFFNVYEQDFKDVFIRFYKPLPSLSAYELNKKGLPYYKGQVPVTLSRKNINHLFLLSSFITYKYTAEPYTGTVSLPDFVYQASENEKPIILGEPIHKKVEKRAYEIEVTLTPFAFPENKTGVWNGFISTFRFLNIDADEFILDKKLDSDFGVSFNMVVPYLHVKYKNSKGNTFSGVLYPRPVSSHTEGPIDIKAITQRDIIYFANAINSPLPTLSLEKDNTYTVIYTNEDFGVDPINSHLPTENQILSLYFPDFLSGPSITGGNVGPKPGHFGWTLNSKSVISNIYFNFSPYFDVNIKY
ncbi:hypothetical protein WKV44_03860 [Spirochaetia bacterium 38H-sp]|uniref:Uncharacterized protein n=1 Tax=Rarispira pelagica TaxID=3141764 RepID=A0ABU9UAH5_9SPIR